MFNFFTQDYMYMKKKDKNLTSIKNVREEKSEFL